MKEQLSREPKPLPKLTIDSSLKNVDDIDFAHIKLEDYDPHPLIRAKMAVVG